MLVRLMVRDDAAQARRAAARLRDASAFVAKTVLLETSWVLERLYGLSPDRTRAALRTLVGLTNIVVEDRAAVLKALSWWEGGLDFADALHLASGDFESFVTFDARLIRDAGKLDSAPKVARP